MTSHEEIIAKYMTHLREENDQELLGLALKWHTRQPLEQKIPLDEQAQIDKLERALAQTEQTISKYSRAMDVLVVFILVQLGFLIWMWFRKG